MHDIHPERNQVGERAAAEIPIPAPGGEAIDVEGLIGRGPEPAFPIELSGIDSRSWPTPQIILEPVGADQGDLSDLACLHHFCGDPEMLPTALLHSDLDDAAGI